MENHVSIIGAGTMGSGIAQLLASRNVNVLLVDQNEDALQRALGRIREQLHSLQEDVDQVISRIQLSTDIQSVQDSWLIIEAVPENLSLKQHIFKQLESVCSSEAILATNTSGLPVSDIAAALNYPGRLIGMHFFMPAHVVPLVEVIKGTATEAHTAEKVMEFLKQMGKKPVLVHKELPGFIGNRIQHALAREAISLLEKGVASAEDIDTVVRYSLGIRLLFTGPLEQRDWNGLDVHCHIASYLYEDLENRTEPSPLLTNKVEQGNLGVKTGKGFYDWQDKDVPSISQNKNRQLLELIKWLDTKEN
ncbi:3-hydroxyacyl-CoA dehydrogenase NAD-binding domain-containing protein [Paenibacillus sp. UNC451MF]|uniref:3-hydroxyacyl-CoA dehydrogenase NAD-binding domain-containing protein n=1 Tax=Paenibacillus sp. UNC451MF TaxID=1449063 RepID=UPI00048C3CD0|nr:3-hydroxyacyl-CoA dehydrogenase NAD-binding domain-containing protein [Paenibacillus sp. UNC451MF]